MMVEEEKAGKERKRTLILCVDRDGDLAVKAGIKTPLVGRDGNLKAAVALALKDPEEADANAMFEAIRIYDKLREEGGKNEVFEVATISGSELGGVNADRRIVGELNDVLGSFPASDVILVTDGYSDQAVLPLIESRVPVSSVNRIVIKHSESIEETAALFIRYIKMITQNPRYSKIALGLPGLLLLILGILSIFNLLYYYWVAFIFIISAFMLVKGFGVDKAVKTAYGWVKEYTPPPLKIQLSNYATIAGMLCITIGCYLGWTDSAEFVANITPPPLDFASWFSTLPQIFAYFLEGSVELIIVGICVVLFGRAARWYIEHDARLLRNSVLIVLIAWSRWILMGTYSILITPSERALNALIFSIIVGILISIAATIVAFVIYSSAGGFFKKAVEGEDELEKG